MSVKACEDVMNVVKIIAISVLSARANNKPLGSFLNSAEFQNAVKTAVPEIPEAGVELCKFNIIDDLELGRYLYNTMTEIVAAVKKKA